MLARGQGGGPPLGVNWVGEHVILHPPMPPTWPNRTGPRPTRLVWYGHASCRLGGQSKHWQKNGLGTCAFWAPKTTHFPPLQAPNSMDSHGTSTMRLVMVWGCQLSILGRIGQVGSKQLGHSPPRALKRYPNHHCFTHISAQTQPNDMGPSPMWFAHVKGMLMTWWTAVGGQTASQNATTPSDDGGAIFQGLVHPANVRCFGCA